MNVYVRGCCYRALGMQTLLLNDHDTKKIAHIHHGARLWSTSPFRRFPSHKAIPILENMIQDESL